MIKLAVFRSVYLNPWDCMTFIALADHGFELFAVGSTVNAYRILDPMPAPFQTIRYEKISDVNWKSFDIVDAPELHLIETSYLCNVHPNVFVTVWDLGISKPTIYRPNIKGKARHFIARSLIARDTLVQDGVPPERISVIPASVDLSQFNFRLREGKSKTEHFVILYVGRLHSTKGIQVLRKVFDRVLMSFCNAELWIAGSGELGLIEPVGGPVKYLGFVDDRRKLAEIYNAADLFVGPSLYEEQFGVVFIEAMASGLPVITTDSGAIPWLVEAQIVVPRATSDFESALQREIERVLGDRSLQRQMSQAAHRTARLRFSQPVVARQLADVYQSAKAD